MDGAVVDKVAVAATGAFGTCAAAAPFCACALAKGVTNGVQVLNNNNPTASPPCKF